MKIIKFYLTFLFCILAICQPNDVEGAPVPFRILGGSLTLSTDPATNVVTDVHGFFGVSGRRLRIDAFQLSPSLPGGPQDFGHLDFASGQISFAVDYKVDYQLRDAATGMLVGMDSVSGLFLESGTFNSVTGQGFLDGTSAPGRANPDTSAQVLAVALPDWLKELLSGRTLILIPDPDEFQLGNVTSLAYLGGVGGVAEMNLLVSSDFAGGIIAATASGSLLIQAVSEPSAVILFGIGLASLLVTWKRRRWRSSNPSAF